MKRYNQYINILNIISSIIYIIVYILYEYDFIIYVSFLIRLNVAYIVVAILNIIITIINFLKHNIKIAISQLVVTSILIISAFFVNKELLSPIVILVSIISLALNREIIQNKKSYIPIILFSIIIIFEILVVSIPIILNFINLQSFENSLSKLEEEKNVETIVYEKDNMYIFLDEFGNEISRKDYDTLGSTYILEINGNIANIRSARKGNKIFMINSQGETLFEIYDFFKDEFTTEEFINYIVKNNSYGIKRIKAEELDNYKKETYVRDTTNVLNKYTLSDSSFEETNNNYQYIYFNNQNMPNKILQIVINKNETENDLKLLDNYVQSKFNNYLNRDMNKIEEFYKYKKEYYLINLIDHTKIKLECNNLIYEAFYNEKGELCENILLYSNGTIPFYDENLSGYFDAAGNRVTIDTRYLILDVDDKYQIITEKSTSKIYFRDILTGNIVKIFESTLILHDSFCIEYLRDGCNIYDRDLKLIEKSKGEPILLGNNIIIGYNGSSGFLYYYNDEKIELVEYSQTGFAPLNSFMESEISEELKEIGDTVYPKVGIVTYE